MPISEGLRSSLNEIRQTMINNNQLYASQIDEISPNTDIGSLSVPLFDNPELMNSFLNVLVKRIIYTQLVNFKLFNNPLAFLEGDKMPLGAIGQDIFINPAKGRKFDVNDFAGLLAKYESDVKVQYVHLNSDIQYPVTITRAKLKEAFVSWTSLENFVDGITQSLYNGCYIDRYNFTKGLVAKAYNDNTVQIKVMQNPNTEALAKQFLTEARALYLNFQEPTFEYNAWRKVGGYGKDVLTFTSPEDIVFLIRNDIGAYLDVNVLASAFNIDKASLLGRVKYVKDFSERDKDGNVVVDGSKILGIMCDKAWFRIKNQETTMDEFYNANNRTWQLYLNDVNMYQYSLFANSIIFATEEPEVTITGMEFAQTTVSVKEGETVNVSLSTTPPQANTPTISYSSTAAGTATATKVDERTVAIKGIAKGSTTVKATSGNVTAQITVNVTAAD